MIKELRNRITATADRQQEQEHQTTGNSNGLPSPKKESVEVVDEV